MATATLVAASRSGSAFERLKLATDAADVRIPESKALEDPVAAVAAVTARPGVIRASAEATLLVRPLGSEYIPYLDLHARAPLEASRTALNKPVIVEGRAVDDNSADEVVLSESLAAGLGASVGDTITLESATTDWLTSTQSGGDPGPPDGPLIAVRVVGIGRTPLDFGRWRAILHLSREFVNEYLGQLHVGSSVEVDLTSEALARAREGDFGDLVTEPFTEIETLDARPGGSTADAMATIAAGLRLTAIAAIVAGTAAVTSLISRFVLIAVRSRRPLAAIGWDRRRQAWAVHLALAPWFITAACAGVIVGTLLSPHTTAGLVRRVDPEPDRIIAGWPQGFAIASAALLVATLTVAVTLRADFPRRRRRPPSMVRTIPLAGSLAVVLGVRQAFFSRPHDGGRANRRAVVAATASVAAVTAALVIGSSIGLLQREPALAGGIDQRLIDSGEALDVYDKSMSVLGEDVRVADLIGFHVDDDISDASGRHLAALIYDVKRGTPRFSIAEGRVAFAADEVTLGPASLEALKLHVGDQIELHSNDATGEFRIVGANLFPRP